MCNCIELTDAKFAERKSNTQIGVSMPYKQIEGRMILDTRVNVSTVKADTALYRKPETIMANFCPFCGEPYKSFEEIAAEAEILAKYPMRENGAYTFWCGTCKGYDGFAMANTGTALGLAKSCAMQEEQNNEVRYEAPGTDTDYSNECQCNAEPEDEKWGSPADAFFTMEEKGEEIGSRVALLLEIEDGRNAVAVIGFKKGDEQKAKEAYSLLISNGERKDLVMQGMEVSNNA